MNGVGAAVREDLLAALPALPPPIANPLPTPLGSWAEAGLDALTAPGAAPVADAAAVASSIGHVAAGLASAAGADLAVDGAALLTARERLSGIRHAPAPGRSLRGGTFLAATADGWAAINLSRPDDRECLPALTLGAIAPDGGGLSSWLRTVTTDEVIARARLLGLAVSGLAEAASRPKPAGPFTTTQTGDLARRRVADLTVLDLSRLWAGPLAGALLARAGAHVVRLIDADSPPPIEDADAAFDAELNGAKETVTLPLRDRSALARRLASADIVITAMRPHALERFPTIPDTCVHVALTAHGTGAGADRVGFGDDCAVAGGLIATTPGGPEFAGDALADPLTGLTAAAAALGMVAARSAGRVDLSLAGTAAWAVAVDRAARRRAGLRGPR